MTFILTDIIIFAIYMFCVVCVTIGIVCLADDNKLLYAAVNFMIATIIGVSAFLYVGWHNANTASGIRAVKDFNSEMSNGIERDITITAEDGREIFHYSGKVDIESDHEDNYIKFESEEGKRYLIYYGIQDTITIIEK